MVMAKSQDIRCCLSQHQVALAAEEHTESGPVKGMSALLASDVDYFLLGWRDPGKMYVWCGVV